MQIAVGTSLAFPTSSFLLWLGRPSLLLVLSVIAGSCVLVVAILYFARRARKPRLDPRQEVESPADVSWKDGNAERRFDGAHCRDFSAGGLGLELPEPIRVGARVTVRVPSLNFRGTGVVRHCGPLKSGYLVGIQFSRLTRVLAGLTSEDSAKKERGRAPR
jgi:hypothetical protein